jgi:hypothetical protein
VAKAPASLLQGTLDLLILKALSTGELPINRALEA